MLIKKKAVTINKIPWVAKVRKNWKLKEVYGN